MRKFTKESQYSVLVVGVDVKSQDGVDFDWFIASQHRTKLPAVECGQDFARHHCAAGFQHMDAAQQSAAIDDTCDHKARFRQACWKIGPHCLWRSKVLGVRLSRRGWIGK